MHDTLSATNGEGVGLDLVLFCTVIISLLVGDCLWKEELAEISQANTYMYVFGPMLLQVA